jgi:hypothetical protein
MVRLGAFLMLTMLISSDDAPFTDAPMSVCDLSNDFPGNRDKVVNVRGVYWYGLDQKCSQKCTDGVVWPSFINLKGGSDADSAALGKALREVEAEAKRTGKRFELWVTVVGRLQTSVKRSPLGPCDEGSWRRAGYGHMGSFPAQITVESLRDIEVRENPQSPYDYAHMYHGPL